MTFQTPNKKKRVRNPQNFIIFLLFFLFFFIIFFIFFYYFFYFFYFFLLFFLFFLFFFIIFFIFFYYNLSLTLTTIYFISPNQLYTLYNDLCPSTFVFLLPLLFYLVALFSYTIWHFFLL